MAERQSEGFRIRKASNIQSAKKVALTVAKARRLSSSLIHPPDLRLQPAQETLSERQSASQRDRRRRYRLAHSLVSLRMSAHDFERDVEDIKAASQKAYDYIMAADETKANALEGQ